MGEYQWHRFDGTDDAFVMVQMGKGSVGKGHDSKKKNQQSMCRCLWCNQHVLKNLRSEFKEQTPLGSESQSSEEKNRRVDANFTACSCHDFHQNTLGATISCQLSARRLAAILERLLLRQFQLVTSGARD
jgi:hypothetical protein